MIRPALVLCAALAACAAAPEGTGGTPTLNYCAPARADVLQEIAGTPASPYFVHHPAAGGALASTIIFLPGGSGARRNALRAWDGYLSGAKAVDAFRIVVPYWTDVDITEGYQRTIPILEEVLACYGGDPAQVHLGGFSNGGHAAFDLMLERPERFRTLLGAPGEFELRTTAAQLTALRGKAVFNGVGERDDDFWHKGVRDAHDMLTAAGVDSVYVEFPGQGHSAGTTFPKDVLFAFWLRHSTLERR